MDFPPQGLLTFCRKPCDLHSKTQIAPSQEPRKVSQNPVAVFSCSGERFPSLSFFSLVFLLPWYFSCWGFPWSFGVFSAHFPGFLRVREVRKFLGVSEVFLGVFEKTKEKKDRAMAAMHRFSFFFCISSLGALRAQRNRKEDVVREPSGPQNPWTMCVC